MVWGMATYVCGDDLTGHTQQDLAFLPQLCSSHSDFFFVVSLCDLVTHDNFPYFACTFYVVTKLLHFF